MSLPSTSAVLGPGPHICLIDMQSLSAAKQGDQGTPALPYHFTFYLHQAPASQQTAEPEHSRSVQAAEAQQTGTFPDGLHKVALTLPPPACTDYAQPDQLPAATQASIGRLLSACGLDRSAPTLNMLATWDREPLSKKREATYVINAHMLAQLEGRLL